MRTRVSGLILAALVLAACRPLTQNISVTNPLAPTTPQTTPATPLIVVAAPQIPLFVAEPSRILLGQTFTMRWDVTAPLGVIPSVRIDPLPGQVAASGLMSIRPFDSGLYTLQITAETTGGRVVRTVQVRVDTSTLATSIGGLLPSY